MLPESRHPHTLSLIRLLQMPRTKSHCPELLPILPLITTLPFFLSSPKKSYNENDVKTLKYRNFSNENVSLFCEALVNTDWNEVFESNDVNQAANNFSVNFLHHFNNFFPVQTRPANRNKVPIEPWFTKGLLISRKTKLKLYKKWQSKGRVEFKERFVLYRNLFNKLCRHARALYYSKQLGKTKKSSSKHWALIKEASGLGKPKQQKIGEIIDGNGKTITDPTLIADAFNEYFANIGKETVKSVPQSSSDFRKFLISIPNSFAIFPLGPYKIVEIVADLHDKYTEDINDISVAFLKKVIYFIAEPLSHVFNLSLSHGEFPEVFKSSKAVPIYKRSGNIRAMGNYRPISIVNCFAKILEKYVAESLTLFFSKNNVISKNQFGFTEGKSTFGCLFDIIAMISQNCHEGKYTAAIYLDIAKAFDTCDHDIILEKLSIYGVRGPQHAWFKSFLSNRTQKVKVGCSWSGKYQPVPIGVPQGSVLGVLLFLVYINDLPNATKFYVDMYADDSTATFSNADPNILESECNKELGSLIDWFSCNRLSLNVSKTHAIIFSPTLGRSPRLNLAIPTNSGSIGINQVPNKDNKSVKSLGLLIDERLTLKSYVDHIIKQMNKSLFFLRRVKRVITLEAMKLLYYSHIHSHLLYCLPLFTLMYRTDLSRLCRVQRKAVKIVYDKNPRSSCDELFHDLGTFPLDILLEKEILKIMHNIHSYRKPPELARFFSSRIVSHQYEFRDTLAFHTPLIKSIRLSATPIYSFPYIFNHFKENFKEIMERSIFTEKMMNYYAAKLPSNFCTKRFCKFCDYDKFIKYRNSFACSTSKMLNYHVYT